MKTNTKIEKREVVNLLSLNKFVYDYAKKHIYISKRALSGLYSMQYPQTLRNMVKRKIGHIFQIYHGLGIAIRYNQNTVKIIDREKLKKMKPEELMKYSLMDFREKKVKNQIEPLLKTKILS